MADQPTDRPDPGDGKNIRWMRVRDYGWDNVLLRLVLFGSFIRAELMPSNI